MKLIKIKNAMHSIIFLLKTWYYGNIKMFLLNCGNREILAESRYLIPPKDPPFIESLFSLRTYTRALNSPTLEKSLVVEME